MKCQMKPYLPNRGSLLIEKQIVNFKRIYYEISFGYDYLFHKEKNLNQNSNNFCKDKLGYSFHLPKKSQSKERKLIKKKKRERRQYQVLQHTVQYVPSSYC